MTLRHGEFADIEEPDWAPLRGLVGDLLTAHFMWMCAYVLDDGRLLHAYKHVATRRYIHVTEAGDTFVYAGERTYLPVANADAIELAYEEWAITEPRPRDPEAVRRELDARIAR
jgi:hypothetical protein